MRTGIPFRPAVGFLPPKALTDQQYTAMRFFSTLLLLFALTAGLPGFGPSDQAVAAGAGKKAASRSGAAAKPAAAQKSPLDKLLDELHSLKQDKDRSKRRDLWLALEEKFTRLQSKSGGENAARAAYYAAEARQELGRHSFLASDRRQAASRYAEVAKRHPKSPVAPSALYQQAVLLKNFLAEPAEAAAVLERLLKRYPKSPEASGAAKLLAEAKKEAASRPDKPAEKPAAASSVTIKNILWTGKPQRALITLQLDGTARYEYEFIPPDPAKKTPGRLYVDIAGASPARSVKPGMAPKSLTVTRIRTAQSGDGTRIMFDCDGLRCFAVRTPKKAPQTIQIELSRNMDIKDGVSVDRQSAGDARSAPGGKKTPAKSDALMEQLGLTVRTIMIDPGHGGKDPGAMAGGIVEREFTLAMAKRLGAALRARGFNVLYTRTGNKFISLQDRPDIANHKKADLFISIHLNANTNPEVRGLETYYLDMAKTQSAAVVAARENAVSVKNISDLQVILADLMLSSKIEESHELARFVHNGILSRVRRARFAAPDNGVRSAPFYVLVGARMPAILVECGYATNKGDIGNLRSDKFLQSQAEGIADGIAAYKASLARVTAR